MGDEESALDCMQDVFARLLELAHPPVEHPSSFLYTVATRLCIDKLRSAAHRHAGGNALLYEIADAEDIESRAFARRLLDRIFHRQEESTRVMAVLHYVDGMTFEEVGEQMEISASGVRRRLEKLKTRVAGLAVRAGRDEPQAWSGKDAR
jgi:RNA polymerase sigma-70 factor (ECF subfamily)